MKYKLILFFVVSFIMIFVCCDKYSGRQALSQADVALSEKKYDSAYHILNKVNSFDLEDGDRALYCLLMTKAMYWLDMDSGTDSLIDFSIRYYYSSKDKEKLAESYYYKGITYYSRDRFNEAIVSLKKAESLLPELNDVDMNYRVFTYISRINFKSENYALSLKYGKKSLRYAKLSGNAKFIALSYNHLACTFEKLGMSDSAYVCVAENMKYADGIKSPQSRAVMYINIADYYYNKGDMKRYESNLFKSMALYVSPYVLNRFALMKYKEGKYVEADSIWHKALSMSDGNGKIEILETIIKNLDEKDNYKMLFHCYKRLGSLKDSINRLQCTQQIQDIQLRYDNDIMKNRYNLIVTRIVIIFVVVFLLSVIAILYGKYKQKQNKTKLLQSQILIDFYNKQIDEYKKTGKDYTRTIKRLEEKLQLLYNEQTDVFTRGRSCYKHVLGNASVVRWKKDDYLDFIEYYKLVNLSFVVQIEREYKSLTPGNKFLLILQDMGKTDAELQKILGTTIGTIRVQQSRIRKKYIGDSASV